MTKEELVKNKPQLDGKSDVDIIYTPKKKEKSVAK